jgi:hypothetical protein
MPSRARSWTMFARAELEPPMGTAGIARLTASSARHSHGASSIPVAPSSNL